MKYKTLQLIEAGGLNRDIEFHMEPVGDGDDFNASISIDGGTPFLLGNGSALKTIKDFIDAWMV